MNRTLMGALSALLLVAAGVFWWQGRPSGEIGVMPSEFAATAGAPTDDPLPFADAGSLRGVAPPEASEATREQKRFDRIDRDRDLRITRNEMLSPRAAAFRKLDRDGNNLLTFEEWAVRTTTRFAAADANRNGSLDRAEFATAKPKRKAQPRCRCAPPAPVRGARGPKPAAPVPDEEELAGDGVSADEGEPAE